MATPIGIKIWTRIGRVAKSHLRFWYLKKATLHVRDKVGFLTSLGQARTAHVLRDAFIGEAEARRDATIAQALTE